VRQTRVNRTPNGESLEGRETSGVLFTSLPSPARGTPIQSVGVQEGAVEKLMARVSERQRKVVIGRASCAIRGFEIPKDIRNTSEMSKGTPRTHKGLDSASVDEDRVKPVRDNSA
jgi:hypothetical protein